MQFLKQNKSRNRNKYMTNRKETLKNEYFKKKHISKKAMQFKTITNFENIKLSLTLP